MFDTDSVYTHFTNTSWDCMEEINSVYVIKSPLYLLLSKVIRLNRMIFTNCESTELGVRLYFARYQFTHSQTSQQQSECLQRLKGNYTGDP